MRIAFNQLPSELVTAVGSITSNVKRGTATATVLTEIEEAVRAQLAAHSDPTPKGVFAKLATRAEVPGAITIELEPRQWRIFKDALLAGAFHGDAMGAAKIQILAETAKTISVGIESAA